MKKYIFLVLPMSIFLAGCQEKAKEETKETQIIENINLNDWRDDYHVGEYFKDTLMYIDGGIGARIAYDFVDKKGNDFRFGTKIDDFDLFNLETGEQNPKYLNKIFIVGHRLMISKGYDNDNFTGDKEIDIVTTIEFLENETPFKIKPKLSEEEKLIEAYKKKYKYTYARYTEYSFGDLAHHIFIDDKNNEHDFMSFEDRTYDLTVEDPNSDSGDAMNLKYKNKYFHIFTKSEKMDPMGWGELSDFDVVVKMILAE